MRKTSLQFNRKKRRRNEYSLSCCRHYVGSLSAADCRLTMSRQKMLLCQRYHGVDIVFIGYSYGCSVELAKCIARETAAITMSCDRRYF